MRRRRRLAALVGLVAVTGVVMQASHAAFSETVVSPGNSWATGAVSLTHNSVGQALFSDTDMVPGTGPAKCIEVTYRGDVDAEVRFYLAGVDDQDEPIASLLRLRIELGSRSSCADPGTWTTLSDATLRTTAAASDFATGLRPGVWYPTAGETRPYRLTLTLADDNAAQGNRADFALTWEAHSR
ncbi:hypothetical protein JIG36_29800 [Actinoplanes sp. LDG1-06]|uniref:Secreted protein n=1 Tax=Paractinoplanes ovalisporus TaxID=2810368 RepID=A0ABS2AIQ1_9ACTN|nr:hypothetical protein [Actinoplanes ovalisporus]MBM2619710.1 hypothetical protein [Actinoplanes ovalisporus]